MKMANNNKAAAVLLIFALVVMFVSVRAEIKAIKHWLVGNSNEDNWNHCMKYDCMPKCMDLPHVTEEACKKRCDYACQA
uniref:Uncharacterized protein n=1 Tax=Nelumbo nucifera TaxID=4432 RepID=A0A822XWP9_NELNU|nr:TPA_asm: hypothetical protein HUJ06_025636 [Nelumbo nucifera]